MSNLLQAIINIASYEKREIRQFFKSRVRANNMGESLEEYIKDAFCNTFNIDDENNRMVEYNKHFSYLGNQNNPPDIILKNGDAIEVKKVESIGSIPLNSSYPKDKLYANSPMITKACRECEDWAEKDIIYAVGVTNKSNSLTHICFVYGEDYAANPEVYERIKNTIKQGVNSISNVDFSESKELGHVNKVDPLGITYLRIRGMWGIENPFKVFAYIYNKKNDGKDFFALINEEKYKTFPNEDKAKLESLSNVIIEDCSIKDPNNTAKLKKAKLIRIV